MNTYVSARPKQRKRLIIVILVVAILFALLIGFNTFKGIMIGKFMKSMGNPPQTVSTMAVEYQEWQPHVEAVGNVRAVHGADLAFDVAGLVESVNVKSGADVKKGQVLIKLVDADDRAKLEALKATAQLARLTADRSKQQLAVQAISKAQYDADMANLKSAQANAAAQQALVDKKTLRAPFEGRIGIITANPGQYINVGTKVVTLQQLDPVYVDFTVPQSSLTNCKWAARSKSQPMPSRARPSRATCRRPTRRSTCPPATSASRRGCPIPTSCWCRACSPRWRWIRAPPSAT